MTDPFGRRSHYDMPRPTNPKHRTAVRGCEPDCQACERDQEIDERNQS